MLMSHLNSSPLQHLLLPDDPVADARGVAAVLSRGDRAWRGDPGGDRVQQDNGRGLYCGGQLGERLVTERGDRSFA